MLLAATALLATTARGPTNRAPRPPCG
jgi:hypothetical protein